MEERELLGRIRVIKTKANRLANEYMAGAYLSVFKGRGMSFEEVRPYQPGDDIRTIDWNVSARTGDVYSKVFVEERELTFYLIVALPKAAEFGTSGMTRRELAAEVAASHAFAAIKNNDRVGLIIYTDRVAHFVPPKKGVTHVLRVVSDILRFKPGKSAQAKGHGLVEALKYARNITKKRVNAVLCGDHQLAPELLDEVDTALSIATRRHELVAFSTLDPLDDPLRRGVRMPACGLMRFEDMDSGSVTLLDTSSRRVRERYEVDASAVHSRVETLFKRHSVEHEFLFTDRDWVPAVNRLYLRKAKRKK